MKNTIITLASVAALTSSANAQTHTIAYSEVASTQDKFITYNNVSDTAANNQASNTASVFDLNRLHGLAQTSTGGYTMAYSEAASGQDKFITFNSLADMLTNNQSSNTASSFAFTSLHGLAQTSTGGYTMAYSEAGTGQDKFITFNSLADMVANNQSSNTASVFDLSRLHGLAQTSTGSYTMAYSEAGTGQDKFITFNSLADMLANNQASNTASTYTFTNLHELSSEQVPEPSSTALLGLGGLALILRRKR